MKTKNLNPKIQAMAIGWLVRYFGMTKMDQKKFIKWIDEFKIDPTLALVLIVATSNDKKINKAWEFFRCFLDNKDWKYKK